MTLFPFLTFEVFQISIYILIITAIITQKLSKVDNNDKKYKI